MRCSTARSWLFRALDGELPAHQSEELDRHLKECPECAREKRLISIPRRIGQAIPVLEPSPHFYARLRARIESEEQGITIWQVFLVLSRHLVPGMAAITLALLSIFAYFQIRGPRVDVSQVYDSIFQSSDRVQRLIVTDPGDISDESVLRAIAEEESARRPTSGSDQTRK